MTKEQSDQALAAVGNSLREQRDRAEAALVELRARIETLLRGALHVGSCSSVMTADLNALRGGRDLVATPADLAARVEARIRAQAFREAAGMVNARATTEQITHARADARSGPAYAATLHHKAAADVLADVAEGLTRLAVDAEESARV